MFLHILDKLLIELVFFPFFIIMTSPNFDSLLLPFFFAICSSCFSCFFAIIFHRGYFIFHFYLHIKDLLTSCISSSLECFVSQFVDLHVLHVFTSFFLREFNFIRSFSPFKIVLLLLDIEHYISFLFGFNLLLLFIMLFFVSCEPKMMPT